MQTPSPATHTEASSLARTISRLNRSASRRARLERLDPVPFGRAAIERFRLGNGLSVLVLVDRAAPVVSYHTWFRVGSRHEKPGKTGLAHLFEHLMFNETRTLPAGAFDLRMERAGVQTNAATWTDWTYYYEDLPAAQLPLVVRLEADRMHNLVLRQPQLRSEKEVVANERRFRVEDDLDGLMDETLFASAFTVHPYHHPTIGWMRDIEAFTTADCRKFYKAFYSPGAATVVAVGDVDLPRFLALVQQYYGELPRGTPPEEPTAVEPPQSAERVVRIADKPTAVARLLMGYHAPGLGHPDHAPLSVLAEVLSGGRSSRVFRALVTEGELATDVSVGITSFRDPGLFECEATGRKGITGERLLAAFDGVLDALESFAVTEDECARCRTRMELGYLQGLETAGGRAEQIGFYATVLDDPAGGLTRLEALRSVQPADLARVAKQYLRREQRTVVRAEPAEGVAQ